MNKLMKRYEAETDEIATWHWHDKEFVTDDYIAWLEAKASTYDRLMSGGKKTLKEWANLTGLVIVVEGTKPSCVHGYSNIPEIFDPYHFWHDGKRRYYVQLEIPIGLVDYTGDWKDSLTLPDGWEEK